MIVLKSTHAAKMRALEEELAEERARLGRFNREYARVVLDNASLRADNDNLRRQLHHESHRFTALASSSTPSTFTADEVKTLIVLCHPDKHGGSKVANEITAKLIKMRKK
jgi:regulator of replication initiation timing